MAQKTECYVDTSALIAFLDRSDSYHALFRRLFSQPPPLLASALVVAEGHAWFLRRYEHNRAVQFLVFIDEIPLNLVAFDEIALKETSVLVKKFADQKITLADSHGLAIMRKRRITSCWSTDRHMALGGAKLAIR